MQIAIVENNIISRIGEFEEIFANVELPITGVTITWLEEHSGKVVNYSKQHDMELQKLEESEAYVEDGSVYVVKVVDLSEEELEAKRLARKEVNHTTYGFITTEHLNKVVKEKDFDSIEEATSYITSSNATWKAESEAIIVWRDAVWAYFYAEMEKETPFSLSIDAIGEASPYIANMPTIAW